MKVIITGGTGLIGRGLAASLAADGHQAIVLSRNPERHRQSLPPAVQLAAWDGRSAQGWAHLVDGAEAIVNLAGEPLAGDTFFALVTRRWTPQQKQRLRQSRLEAGAAVLQAVQLARHKPAVLLQASAVGFYGDRGDEPLPETARPGADFAARLVQEWEASTAPLEALGLRRVVLRTAGSVLSLEGGSFPFLRLPFRLFLGGPLGNGRQWFAWIHQADQIRALRFLLEQPQAQGVFNLNAPQPLPNREFARWMGQVLKRPAWLPVPAFALRLLFGEKVSILLGSQRQIPERLQALGFQWLFPTAELALRDLLT